MRKEQCSAHFALAEFVIFVSASRAQALSACVCLICGHFTLRVCLITLYHGLLPLPPLAGYIFTSTCSLLVASRIGTPNPLPPAMLLHLLTLPNSGAIAITGVIEFMVLELPGLHCLSVGHLLFQT